MKYVVLPIATVIHWFFKFLAFLVAGFVFYVAYFLVIVWHGKKPVKFFFYKHIAGKYAWEYNFWEEDEIYITPLDWFLNRKLSRYDI